MSLDRTIEPSQPQLFNTPLEAGLRAVVILDAFAPRAFDLATLSILDYYAVHTGDIDAEEIQTDGRGPSEADIPPIDSLHPPLDARKGEYFVRRRLVEEGIAMMERAFLLDRVADAEGLSFRACDTAAAMVDLMESEYNTHLRSASRWLALLANNWGEEAFFNRLAEGVDRWSHEIDGEILS